MPHIARSARCVLLVEDNEDGREAVAILLRDEGYQVETAADGSEALQLLGDGLRPAVVVTDLMMPGMSGWQLLDVLRGDPAYARLPVIVVTAAMPGQVPGSDCVLPKPLRVEDLTEQIALLSA